MDRRYRIRQVCVSAFVGVLTFALAGSLGRWAPFGRSDAARYSAMAVTAGHGELVLNEEFNGSQLDSTLWNRCHWWGRNGCTIDSNNELQWYTPDGVAVADGALQLRAVRRPVVGSDGATYDYRSGMVTSGRVSSDPKSLAKFAFLYGRMEVRARVPRGEGLWPALWLLPITNKSRPEIDLLEVRGSATDRMSMHVHTTSPSGKRVSNGSRWVGQDLADGWHTFALDWRAGSLRWFVDGVQVWNVDGAMVPSEPLYIVANLAVGGDWPGPPSAATRFPSTFEIDYVRVWRQR